MINLSEIAKTIAVVNKDEHLPSTFAAWHQSLMRARYWRTSEAKDFMALWARDVEWGVGFFACQEMAENTSVPNTICDDIPWLS